MIQALYPLVLIIVAAISARMDFSDYDLVDDFELVQRKAAFEQAIADEFGDADEQRGLAL